MELLVYLAQHGALSRLCEFSTVKLAKALGMSQQTVSRRLMRLEEEGKIERQASTRGVNVKLTSQGQKELRTLYAGLKKALEPGMTSLKGKVVSGLGEGAYYMGLRGYQEQFRKLLGFAPYAGTLNFKVDPAELDAFTLDKEKIIIPGFSAHGRTYGGLDAYLVHISGKQAALIIPHRTSHNKEIAELICPVHLRTALKLKDTDAVEVEP